MTTLKYPPLLRGLATPANVLCRRTEVKRMTEINHLGGSYLKPDGTLKRSVTVVIDSRGGGAREINGKFGPQLEIPITIEGMQFVVGLPANKGDGEELKRVLGNDLSKWTGSPVQVSESAVLARIRVQPIAPNGHHA